MAKNKWNKDTMQQYCNDVISGYTVKDTKWVQQSYQKQLWALIQCPNKKHEPHWYWWNNFKKGYLCKDCYYEANNMLRWNNHNVIDFYKKYDLNIIDISQYKDVDTRIACIDNDSFKYSTSITQLRQMGKRSSNKFSIYNPYTIENINRFCKLFRPEYEIVSNKYIGIKKEYEWKYNGDFYDYKKHDRLFKCTADNFINGFVKHPDLTRSKLDLEIRKYLNKYNIYYKTEVSFEGCFDKQKLLFDFYIVYNNKQYCIEADGLQHNMIVDGWGGLKGLEDRIKKDNIKNEFCKTADITLIRIPQEKFRYVESIIISKFNIDTNINYICKNCHIKREELTSKKIEKIISIIEISNELKKSNYNFDLVANKYGMTIRQLKYHINKANKKGLCDKFDCRNTKVICIDSLKIYNTLLEASYDSSVEKTNISACCRGKRKTAGGLHWMYYDKYLKSNSIRN